MTTTTTADDGQSAFKRAQVRYRRQGAGPNRIDDLGELIDFSNPKEHDRIVPIAYCDGSKERANGPLLYEGHLYGLSSRPGFVYAPQALSAGLQSDLAYSAVTQYCEHPHRTNIDLLPPRAGEEKNNTDDESMWSLWKQTHGFARSRPVEHHPQQQKKYRSFDKLSWSTMGYHYDWTARTYHEGAKSPVPSKLAELAAMFARTSLCVTEQQSSLSSSSRIKTFTGSACIVNYYHSKSIMGGHRDDLEYALDKPVVSLSLGLPAVFLLGGNTKQDADVLPILVRPGDVMMLGGDSRLCYHGMARVLPAGVPLPPTTKRLASPPTIALNGPVLEEESSEDVSSHKDLLSAAAAGEKKSSMSGRVPVTDQAPLEMYLSQHRININVRQVLPDNEHQIPEKTLPLATSEA